MGPWPRPLNTLTPGALFHPRALLRALVGRHPVPLQRRVLFQTTARLIHELGGDARCAADWSSSDRRNRVCELAAETASGHRFRIRVVGSSTYHLGLWRVLPGGARRAASAEPLLDALGASQSGEPTLSDFAVFSDADDAAPAVAEVIALALPGVERAEAPNAPYRGAVPRTSTEPTHVLVQLPRGPEPAIRIEGANASWLRHRDALGNPERGRPHRLVRRLRRPPLVLGRARDGRRARHDPRADGTRCRGGGPCVARFPSTRRGVRPRSRLDS